MHTFIYRSSFPIKKESLFHFHEDPIGFKTLVGGTKGVEIIKAPKSLQVGEEVILKVTILPFWKQTWIAKHIAYEKITSSKITKNRVHFGNSYTHIVF